MVIDSIDGKQHCFRSIESAVIISRIKIYRVLNQNPVYRAIHVQLKIPISRSKIPLWREDCQRIFFKCCKRLGIDTRKRIDADGSTIVTASLDMQHQEDLDEDQQSRNDTNSEKPPTLNLSSVEMKGYPFQNHGHQPRPTRRYEDDDLLGLRHQLKRVVFGCTKCMTSNAQVFNPRTDCSSTTNNNHATAGLQPSHSVLMAAPCHCAHSRLKAGSSAITCTPPSSPRPKNFIKYVWHQHHKGTSASSRELGHSRQTFIPAVHVERKIEPDIVHSEAISVQRLSIILDHRRSILAENDIHDADNEEGVVNDQDQLMIHSEAEVLPRNGDPDLNRMDKDKEDPMDRCDNAVNVRKRKCSAKYCTNSSTSSQCDNAFVCASCLTHVRGTQRRKYAPVEIHHAGTREGHHHTQNNRWTSIT